MTNRKKTSRNPSSPRGLNLNALRQAIRKFGVENFVEKGSLDESSDISFAMLNRPVKKISKTEQWSAAFIQTRTRLGKFVANEKSEVDSECQITQIFEDGMIVGTCRPTYSDKPGLTSEYRLFINHPGKDILVGCSCRESDGKAACSHTSKFLGQAIAELNRSWSTLYQRVAAGRFDVKQPKESEFRYDVAYHVKLALSRLVIPSEVLEFDDGELPPIEEKASQRLFWDLNLSNGSIGVNAIAQQEKKRGGWTKGRKISLGNLTDYHHIMSPIDRKIADLVRFDYSYYRIQTEIDIFDAINLLCGQSNVSLNGQPVEISQGSSAIRLCRDTENCWLYPEAAVASGTKIAASASAMLFFNEQAGTIIHCKLRPIQLQCLQSLVQTPKIPLEFESHLVEKARQLQKLFTVNLPPELAGEVVKEKIKAIILLRSQANGILDYGIRIRNEAGKLFAPGGGLLCRAVKQAGQTVQVQRDAQLECNLATKLLRELKLPTDDFTGSLDNFEEAMSLLESLESIDPTEAEVLWDKQSEPPIRVLGMVTNKNVSVGITSKRDWFQLSGKCDFGSESIELVDLLEALQAKGEANQRGEYIRVGDKGWTRIADDLKSQLAKLRDVVSQERKTLKFDATAAYQMRELLQQNVEVKASAAWTKCLTRLETAERFEPKLPKDLNAELRQYQLDGYHWLRRLSEWGVGGVLADDMGLGKTLQTLAVLLDRRKSGPTLVIAPTSVGFNWMRETEKFAPQLEAHLYRETERADFLKQVGPGSLVVCSYGLALRDAEALAEIQWSNLVLDEAQAIKNSRSKTSLAIATIPADWKIALTGTPVENHLGELWSLFHVVSPGVFGGWEQFRKRFAAPIEKGDDVERKVALQERLKPFVLRRTKSAVLKDLPPRSEMNLYVELGPEERAMYERVRQSAIGEIDQIANLKEINDQRFRILALLTRLRQLACSPKMVHEEWTDRSAKLVQLSQTLKELQEEGHRVLIFSQFVKHLDLIRTMLDEENITFEYLDGSTPAAERQNRVDRFQNGTATAFLISLKAGGTGLNLTAADYVIHMDPWWNPAVEDQATDRAHRIGQDKPVMVYRLVAKDTIEEEILKLHESKRDLVAGVLEGAHTASKLSTADLIDMLRR